MNRQQKNRAIGDAVRVGRWHTGRFTNNAQTNTHCGAHPMHPVFRVAQYAVRSERYRSCQILALAKPRGNILHTSSNEKCSG